MCCRHSLHKYTALPTLGNSVSEWHCTPCAVQVAYYLQERCGAAMSSFLRADVTGALSELPLDCSTLGGANDRAAGSVLLPNLSSAPVAGPLSAMATEHRCEGQSQIVSCLYDKCHAKLKAFCDTIRTHVLLHEALIWAACLAAEPILDIAAIGMNKGLTSNAVTIVNAAANGEWLSAAASEKLESFRAKRTEMKTRRHSD